MGSLNHLGLSFKSILSIAGKSRANLIWRSCKAFLHSLKAFRFSCVIFEKSGNTRTELPFHWSCLFSLETCRMRSLVPERMNLTITAHGLSFSWGRRASALCARSMSQLCDGVGMPRSWGRISSRKTSMSVPSLPSGIPTNLRFYLLLSSMSVSLSRSTSISAFRAGGLDCKSWSFAFKNSTLASTSLILSIDWLIDWLKNFINPSRETDLPPT